MIASTRALVPAMGRQIASLAVCLGLAFAANVLVPHAVAAQPQTDPLAAEFVKRDSELQDIKAEVAKARALRTSFQAAIAGLRSNFEGRKDTPAVQARQVSEQIRQGDMLMRRHGALDRFASHANHIQNAVDAAYELGLLNDALRDDRLKTAASGLREAAAKAGNAVPQLAGISEVYESSISRLSQAVGATIQQINAMRAQARLKSNLYGGTNDKRYLDLVADWGREIAEAAVFEPTSPWEIFRPVPQPGKKSPGLALIWDESERDWYRVNATVPLEAMFRDAFIGLGKRPSAGRLKYIADNIAQVKAQQNAAAAVARHLIDARAETGTVRVQTLTHMAGSSRMADALQDPEVFRAKFVFDNAFREWVLGFLDEFRQELIKQGAPAAAFLKRLDAMLAAQAIKLESQWARNLPPLKGSVRVTAWFSDRPAVRFVSTWTFDRERVIIDANNGDTRDNGSAQGIRTGAVVRSERSLPGRNCVASDERVFEEGGRISFTSVYVCTRDDGTLQTNSVTGMGIWEAVSSPETSKL